MSTIYNGMPTINYSVTQSIDTLAVNLSASEALVMNINNPLVGASYFGLETIPNSDGIYTSASPKNTLGSFTLGTGIIGLVKDDYKMNAVVSPGDSILTFSPSSAVTGSTLRTRGINSSISYDADALAFFTRVGVAGGTLSGVEMYAVNTLVLSLKANSLWTPMKAIYPMVGSSAAACAQNLKSSSFTGTFSNGWTFASTGATPNGTSAFMNTGFNASTNFSLTSFGFGGYTSTSANRTTDSYHGAMPPDYLMHSFHAFGVLEYYPPVGSRLFINGGVTGMVQCNQLSTSAKVYANNTIGATATKTFTTLPNQNMYIGGVNNNGTAQFFDNHLISFYYYSDGLTDTQASNFYTAVQAFQTTLSRQV